MRLTRDEILLLVVILLALLVGASTKWYRDYRRNDTLPMRAPAPGLR